jgi:hypothetical protein
MTIKKKLHTKRIKEKIRWKAWMQDKKVYNRKESKVKSTLKKTLNEENPPFGIHNNRTSVFRSNKKNETSKKRCSQG